MGTICPKTVYGTHYIHTYGFGGINISEQYWRYQIGTDTQSDNGIQCMHMCKRPFSRLETHIINKMRE